MNQCVPPVTIVSMKRVFTESLNLSDRKSREPREVSLCGIVMAKKSFIGSSNIETMTKMNNKIFI